LLCIGLNSELAHPAFEAFAFQKLFDGLLHFLNSKNYTGWLMVTSQPNYGLTVSPASGTTFSARGASVRSPGNAMTRAGFEYLLEKHATASQQCPSLQGKRISPHVLRHTCALRWAAQHTSAARAARADPASRRATSVTTRAPGVLRARYWTTHGERIGSTAGGNPRLGRWAKPAAVGGAGSRGGQLRPPGVTG